MRFFGRLPRQANSSDNSEIQKCLSLARPRRQPIGLILKITMLLTDVAVRYSLAASLAYLPPQQLATGASDYAKRLSFAFLQQVTIDDLAASATIFSADDGDCLVAFRGSTELRNYASMFNLFFTENRLGKGAGKVHRGYQEASQRLYEKLAPVLESTAAPEKTTFIGHSYGGGTATMCALMHQPRELVTFAGPRIGDAAFASSFDGLLGERTTHLVHDADPVLAQNQPLWNFLGFVHTGQLVRCSPTEPRLLADDEERSVLPPTNFADHARYLGTTMGLDP